MDPEITFLPETKWYPDRQAVLYHAEQGDRLILCRISREALQARWANEEGRDARDTFEAHRAAIENVTRELIRRDRFEPDGSIAIRLKDIRQIR
jgi:hypothetical protein